jgi:hypothetical protein
MRATLILSLAPNTREGERKEAESEEVIPSPAAAAVEVFIKDLRFDMGKKLRVINPCKL